MLLHVVIALALAAPPATEPSTAAPADAASSWDRADALAADGRHDDAVIEYERAWAELGAPPILYSWAQSERLRGRCAEAMALYDRFLEHGAEPPPSYAAEPLRSHWASMRANAQAQVTTCREQVQRDAESRPTTLPPTVEPEVVPPVVEAPRTPPRRSPKPWWRDAAGWSLFGSGVAFLVTGATLVGVAATQSNNADDRATHQEFHDAIDRALLEQRIGLAALALGGALVIGGGIRWAVVTRRGRAARSSVQLSVRGLGLGVRGRF